MALVSKTFSDIITFSRTSGATWFNAAGNLVGVDFSVTSVTIGTGSKTFTLDATAGVNRSWATGDSVLISEQSNSANNMTGTVTSYTASTQVLVVNVTSTGGSGTIASWRVSSLMPRFDYNPSTLAAQGLLIEEARTNLQINSEDFTSVDWIKGSNTTITANSVNSPAGILTADTFGYTAVTSGVVQVADNQTKAASAITYTGSIYVKASAGLFFHFYVDANSTSNSGRVIVDTSNWTVFSVTNFGTFTGTSGTVTDVGGGWYRITCTTTSGTETNIRFNLYWSTSNSTITFTPAGTEQVYIWGAQLEAGAFPTSYIPTTVGTVTRAADVASVNTLSPWYNAAEGAFYAEGSFIDIGAGTAAVISSGTNARYAYRSSSGILRAFDGTTVTSTTNATSANSVFKVATGYTQNTSLSICLNAGTVATAGTLAAAFTSGTSLVLGNLAAGNAINGYLRRITYYPRRLSNAELQAITA